MSQPRRYLWALTLSALLALGVLHHHFSFPRAAAPPTPPLSSLDATEPSRTSFLDGCDVSQLRYHGGRNVTGCPLGRIDPLSLLPPVPELLKHTRWISYMGDSLVRSPFLELVGKVAGEAWEANKKDFNASTYFADMTFCCRDRRQPHTCALGRWSFEYTGDSTDYVREFLNIVDPAHVQPFCATWFWQNVPDDSFVTRAQKALEREPHPDLLVINPGLHGLNRMWPMEALDKAVGVVMGVLLAAVSAQHGPSAKTHIIYHELSHLQESSLSDVNHSAQMSNQHVTRMNGMIKAWICALRAGQYISTLPINVLTARGDVLPQGDGLHYLGNFQPITVQLDLLSLAQTAPQSPPVVKGWWGWRGERGVGGGVIFQVPAVLKKK